MSNEGVKKQAGRPPKLRAEHEEILRELVQVRPVCSLEELRRSFAARTGMEVSVPTLRAGLAKAGVERKMAPRGSAAEQPTGATPQKRRYGYTKAHREGGQEGEYASCLTDAEWALAVRLFERQAGQGKPPKYERRRMVSACCYLLRTGCAWRQLPKDFPPWQAVHKAFMRWAVQGKFEQLHDVLRAQWRERLGKYVQPTAAVLDAQSTRISPQGGESGFDAGKKVKGRKRNIVVDTCGLLLAVVVTAASVQDRDAAGPAMNAACAKYPGIKKLYVDGAYSGQCAQALHAAHGIEVEVVRRSDNRLVGQWTHAQLPLFESTSTFQVLPKRWIVERTHAWNERSRRLVMHHDRNLSVSEAWVWLAEARMLVRRLTS